jgi:deoxyadenosine/deoxycytidine kinase
MNDRIREPPFTISLEGAVGVGKTKFLNYLKTNREMENVVFLDETLERWENFHGKNLLEMFYAEPEQFAFTFQNYALLSLIERQIPSENCEIRIMERSPTSSIQIFAESMKKAGHITEVQSQILHDWYDMIKKNKLINLDIDAHVYIKTPVSIALDRIAFRNRQGEQNLTEVHAEQLEQAHENWLLQKDKNEFDIELHSKIFILDGSKTGRDINKEYIRAIEWIKTKKIQRDGVWLQQQ